METSPMGEVQPTKAAARVRAEECKGRSRMNLDRQFVHVKPMGYFYHVAI